MKKMVLTSLFTIVVSCLMAQWYTKNLDAYVGTWEYTDDTTTFRIFLKKGVSSLSTSHEIVYGGQYLARNGVVIIDQEAAVQRATDKTRGENGLTMSASNFEEEESEVNPNVLAFGFFDDLKDKGGSGTLTLYPKQQQLRWQILQESERVYLWTIGVDPKPVFHEGWTFPEDVILTKIAGSTSIDIDAILDPGGKE
ncbi:MAG: hypothetical protein FWH23_06170 [Bacteroidales bacterium]|nr:hypothetical protein [Bacteroidales bacterium]